MLSDRTKVVRGVMAFLAGCAVLGFIMGLRGAMPPTVDPEYDPAPRASTPSGVIVDASPQFDEPAVTEEKAEDEEAEDEAAEPEPEPEPQAPPPAPEPAPPPAVARDEAPPADPVGDLLESPSPTLPPGIY